VERRAQERYDTLDRFDAELNWYRGQYNALDVLVEALRTPDRWMVYRAEALCHTRFPEGNQMHLICVPGSSSTHMIDKMSVIS
jgi:hypothetical protein